ncbi:fibronectin type III domain-containing protein [Paraliomyxa miuraensis]|uniref:hypothetical protein n=1 Tax=Paraliomyxa miuraensis TaxID=376150 RepID=UPI0022590C3F|nr:hypothetical protein [Paraliomyxa miuraensis]MCX4246776.1 hypothetical protein [Paraliomyxa miuraensis]
MSEPEDQALREAFARGGTPGSEPVDPHELWAVVRGEAERETAARLTERLARDATLLEEWTIARAFAEQATDADEREGSTEVAANTRSHRSWSILAAVAAAVLLAVLVWPAPEDLRYEPGSHEVRSGTASTLRSTVDGPLHRTDATLSWTAVEGATRYEVQVTTDDLEPVLTARDLTRPTVTIDPARLRALPPGTTLLWRVEAVVGDGTRERSETFTTALQ